MSPPLFQKIYAESISDFSRYKSHNVPELKILNSNQEDSGHRKNKVFEKCRQCRRYRRNAYI